MRPARFISLISLIAFLQSNGFGQSPTNDHFTNRSELVGSSVSFTGTLAGATIEGGEWGHNCLDLGSGTVWWSWTAPENSQVIIFLGEQDFDANGGIQVLVGTNLNDLTAVACAPIHSIPFPFAAFLATAGETYNIRLSGQTFAPFSLRLVATNAPILLYAPRTRTVSSNEPTLFTVVAGGVLPLSYQWMHHGTNLPGKTAAMLAITNANAATAGSYSVMVSNVAGSVVSSVTQLTVSESVIRPQLVALTAPGGGGRFSFNLIGEVGRAYRIESSTDLVTWSPQESGSVWPTPSWDSAPTSVVINSNVVSTYSVALGSGRRFFRATIYEPYKNALCLINQTQVMLAKHYWARETQQIGSTTPTETELAPHISGNPAATNLGYLACPEDTAGTFATSYTINAVDTAPNCQIVPQYDWLQEPLY